jgi:hypothetical protein
LHEIGDIGMDNKSNAVVIKCVDFRGSVSYFVEFDFFDEELNEVVRCKSAMLPESQAKDMAESINSPVDVESADLLF